MYPSSVGPSNSSSSRLKTGAPGIKSGKSSMYSSKIRFFTLEPDTTTCWMFFVIIIVLQFDHRTKPNQMLTSYCSVQSGSTVIHSRPTMERSSGLDNSRAPAVSRASATGLHENLPLKPDDALNKLSSSAYSCSRCTGPMVETVPLLQFWTMDSDTSMAETRDSPETVGHRGGEIKRSRLTRSR